MHMPDRSAVIAHVCQSLELDGPGGAASVIRQEWPFVPPAATKRVYGPAEALRVFVRDGFVDRYSGARLVFPPVLHIIHRACPDVFPHHPAWRTDATHPAFNELAATIDHVIPVTLGGRDDESNWVTTSMARNFAKSNFTLQELGWELRPPGDLQQWDGMLAWYVSYVARRSEVRRSSAIGRWFKAARLALPTARRS